MALASGDNPFAGRRPVRYIAVIDILFSILFIVFYSIKWYNYKEDEGLPIPKGLINMQAVFLGNDFLYVWVSVIIIHLMQVITGIILLNAAYDNDPEDCLGKCQMWWCTSQMGLTASVIEIFSLSYIMIDQEALLDTLSFTVMALKLVFRILALTIVKRLMKNLKRAPPNSVHQKVYIRSKTMNQTVVL